LKANPYVDAAGEARFAESIKVGVEKYNNVHTMGVTLKDTVKQILATLIDIDSIGILESDIRTIGKKANLLKGDHTAARISETHLGKAKSILRQIEVCSEEYFAAIETGAKSNARRARYGEKMSQEEQEARLEREREEDRQAAAEAVRQNQLGTGRGIIRRLTCNRVASI
jgi:hypothetical protein